MLECTKDEDTMIALCNGAEINANFEAEDGNIYELSVGDVYSICPNNNRWLIYDLSGSELAQLLADGVANSAYGDQVSGLTFTYNNNGTAEEPDIEIVSITLDNGTSVDISGTEAKYRVVISSGCANQPGSVFEGKEALHAELDSPVDNQSIIAYLRDRRDRGQVHIPTDSDSRSTWLNEPSE
jgi:2',3'-cyclic-nucleotide 2'-phosphodiesterase (5'-nucleotidase family)